MYICVFFVATIALAAPVMWAGANLPWNSFGYDIGGGAWDAGWFDNALDKLEANGANSARFFGSTPAAARLPRSPRTAV